MDTKGRQELDISISSSRCDQEEDRLMSGRSEILDSGSEETWLQFWDQNLKMSQLAFSMRSNRPSSPNPDQSLPPVRIQYFPPPGGLRGGDGTSLSMSYVWEGYIAWVLQPATKVGHALC